MENKDLHWHQTGCLLTVLPDKVAEVLRTSGSSLPSVFVLICKTFSLSYLVGVSLGPLPISCKRRCYLYFPHYKIG